MNITPRSIFKGTNADGTKFTAQEWDFATASNLEVTGLLGMLIVGLLFCSIASPILLVFCIYNFTGRIIIPHIIGLVISAYFLYDCYSGWLGLSVLNLVFEESTINFLVAFNVVAFLTHAVFLIFGWQIFLAVEDKENPSTGVLTIVVIILFIGLIIGFGVTKRGWISRNLKGETTKVEDNRSIEQIKQDYETEYEESRRKQGLNPHNEFDRK